MVSIRQPQCYSVFLCIFSIVLLTGCPEGRWRFDEEATVSARGKNICFAVPDAGEYQPVNIAINPRGTPSKNQQVIFKPTLSIVDGLLCIPPSLYVFPEKGQFIVSFVLHSVNGVETSRRFISGVEVDGGCVFNFPLTDKEIARPYSEIQKRNIKSEQYTHTDSCKYPYSSTAQK